MREVGVARRTLLATACSISPGSCSSAAVSSGSPGMNATTNSGEGSTRFQYSFLARASTWAFIWRPWLARWERRVDSSSASLASRKACMGTLASTATFFPPGRCTTMSGRMRPPSASEVTCSSKSQCSSMPAISTTRRSCSSPQRPRGGDQVAGLLLQLVVRGREVLHLFGERRVRPLALDLEALHPRLVLAQLLADRLEQLLDGLLALGQLPVGRLAGLVELGVGQLKELVAVLLQRRGGQAGKLSQQLIANLVEGGCPLGGRLALVVELGGQTGRFGLERHHPLLFGDQLRPKALELLGEEPLLIEGVGEPGLGGPGRRDLVGADQQSHREAQGDAGDEAEYESGDHDESSSGPRGAQRALGGKRTETVCHLRGRGLRRVT